MEDTPYKIFGVSMVDKPTSKRPYFTGASKASDLAPRGDFLSFGFALRRLLGRLRWRLGNLAEHSVECGFALVSADLARRFNETRALVLGLCGGLARHPLTIPDLAIGGV